MSYQKVYEALNGGLKKKASSEQLVKLASLIGMRKRAQEERVVPMHYINQRDAAWRGNKSNPLNDSLGFFSYLKPTRYLAHEGIISNVSDLPKQRNKQVNEILQTLYFHPNKKSPAPGSNDYNALRKYWLQRGERHWHNFEHPEEYLEQVPVPEFQEEYPDLTPEIIRGIGNGIVDNNSSRKHKTHV